MPVLINEIIIKAQVVPDTNYSLGGKGHQNEKAIERELIIRECIEQVMEILKAKNER